MSILKYNLNKYLKSYSTWIITLLSIILIIFLGGYVPFKAFKNATYRSAEHYLMAMILVIALITSFLSTFISVFAGFKAASMFKDEIENGTFLIILSKPISRSKIIMFKWFSLLLILVLYTFILALTFAIAISIFDHHPQDLELKIANFNFSSLRSKVWIIALLLWAILMVMALIFSSLALLLSTKLSVASTIGICVGIGVLIPATGMIGQFARQPSYKLFTHSKEEIWGLHSKKIASIFEKLGITPEEQNLAGTEDLPTLYQGALRTGEEDFFKHAWLFDLNFQINNLASIIIAPTIPPEASQFIALKYDYSNIMGNANHKLVKKSLKKLESENLSNQELFDVLIENSWKALAPLRKKLITRFNQFFRNFELSKNEMNSNWIFYLNKMGIETKKASGKEILKQALNFNYWTKSLIKQAYYFKLIDELISYSNYKIQSLNTKNIDKIKQLFPHRLDFHYLQILKFVISPLALFSGRKVSHFMQEHNVKNLKQIKPVLKEKKVPLLMIDHNLKDYNAYSQIANCIKQGYNVVKVESLEYVNRFNLLYVYLAIALALLPIVFWIIKRQDFR